MRFLFRTALAAGLAIAALPAMAQGNDPSVTEKLIDLLVKNGVLKPDQADALLRQAQAEARQGRKTPREARAPAAGTPATQAEPAAETAPTAPSTPGNTVHVQYVPQIIQQRIADQVRAEVMSQARAEGWATPNQVPDWVQRITIFGDLRMRGEGDLYDHKNDPLVDFPTINAGSGYDTRLQVGNVPALDTTADRERFRLRARLGAHARVSDDVSATIEIATGNDGTPVTANQTLGQNGPFTKYQLWIDRAWIEDHPTDWLTLLAGRSPNPFWTSDLLFWGDLGFDGFSATAANRFLDDDALGTYLTVGGFPIFNTALNFATTDTPKEASHDSWLVGVQGAVDYRFNDTYTAKVGVGYFDFANVQGKLSQPCITVSETMGGLQPGQQCSTDNTRPLFEQFGNTYFPIRNLVGPSGTIPTSSLPQYYGLASKFQVLDIHGRLDADWFHPIDVAFEADYVNNLGFNRTAIANRGSANFDPGQRGPFNNFNQVVVTNASGTTSTVNGTYGGGNEGFVARVTVGTPVIAKLWDWSASAAYKYIESDAVLDALNDPDFHLGGTNAKGYILQGSLGVSDNTFVSLRWFSADEIVGPHYGVDVLQADLNVKF